MLSQPKKHINNLSGCRLCPVPSGCVCVQLVLVYRAKVDQKCLSHPQGPQKCIGEGVKHIHQKYPKIRQPNAPVKPHPNRPHFSHQFFHCQLLSRRTNIIFSSKVDSCLGAEMNMAWGRYMQRRWPNVAANSALSWSFRARPSLVRCHD